MLSVYTTAYQLIKTP